MTNNNDPIDELIQYAKLCLRMRELVIESLCSDILFSDFLKIKRPQSTIMKREFALLLEYKKSPQTYQNIQKSILSVKKIRSCLKIAHRQAVKSFLVEWKARVIEALSDLERKRYTSIASFVATRSFAEDKYAFFCTEKQLWKRVNYVLDHEKRILETIGLYFKVVKNANRESEKYRMALKMPI